MGIHVRLDRAANPFELARRRVEALFSLMETGIGLGYVAPTRVRIFIGGPSEALGGKLLDSLPPRFGLGDAERVIDRIGSDFDNHTVEVDCTFLPGYSGPPATATAFNLRDWSSVYGDVCFESFKTRGKTFADLYFQDGHGNEIRRWINEFASRFPNAREIDFREEADESEELGTHLIYRRRMNDFGGDLIDLIKVVAVKPSIRQQLKAGELPEKAWDKMDPFKTHFLVGTLLDTKYPSELIKYAKELETMGCDTSGSLLLYGKQRDSFVNFLRVVIPPLVQAFGKLPLPENLTRDLVELANKIRFSSKTEFARK